MYIGEGIRTKVRKNSYDENLKHEVAPQFLIWEANWNKNASNRLTTRSRKSAMPRAEDRYACSPHPVTHLATIVTFKLG
jgi:hypothetical protein